VAPLVSGVLEARDATPLLLQSLSGSLLVIIPKMVLTLKSGTVELWLYHQSFFCQVQVFYN
jgi:hypothetical protein